MTVTPLNGQSNFDLCQQITGSLDGFISFCMNNGVTDDTLITQNSYSGTPVNINIAGFPYATRAIYPSDVFGVGDFNPLDFNSSDFYCN